MRATTMKTIRISGTEIELLVGLDGVAVPWFPRTRFDDEVAVDAGLAPVRVLARG